MSSPNKKGGLSASTYGVQVRRNNLYARAGNGSNICELHRKTQEKEPKRSRFMTFLANFQLFRQKADTIL